MPIGSHLFRKVTIVGVGLIGGSLGLAIKKNQVAREVVGYSQRHATLDAAIKSGAIDQGYQDLKKAVQNADLVILATPVSIISGMMTMLGPNLRRGCIVTDVGSIKKSIIDAAEQHLPSGIFFVGSHPMAGSEKRGVENASAELFVNATCLVTPTKRTHRGACERIKKFWSRLGTNIKTIDPEKHDKILAYTSHLPHLCAYALMGVIPVEYLEYSAQGLKDTTRIAGSSAQLWADICLENSTNILKGLDETVKTMGVVRRAIIAKDPKSLVSTFEEAKNKRDKLV